MKQPEESVTTVGSVLEIQQLTAAGGPYALEDVDRLIDTFPWWTRVISWWLWRTPVRRLLAPRFHSPYETLIAKLRPHQTGDNLSHEQPVPIENSLDGDSK